MAQDTEKPSKTAQDNNGYKRGASKSSPLTDDGSSDSRSGFTAKSRGSTIELQAAAAPQQREARERRDEERQERDRVQRRTRAPKCRICKVVSITATAEPAICPDCKVVVGNYVEELLTRDGVFVKLTCSWKPCPKVFYSSRSRDPAYCGVNCKMKAYYRRRTGKARVEAARLLGTSRERPVRSTLPPFDESAQTGTE